MNKEEFMIEEISKEVVLLMMKEHKMSLEEALAALYNSDTYASLCQLEIELYAQSTSYIYYEYLKNEQPKGKMC